MHDSLAVLASRWREVAATLRTYGAESAATALERCADELDSHAASVADATLSLDEAATASGYSVTHLRRLVAQGVLSDVGTNGVTALRQQDLPYKPGRQRHPRPLGVLSSLI